ncbi:MAG: FG-GAP repeat protein [Dokdonella sp.]|nr:FG-GAP repeat protein [Dokdonella sp.]MCB1572402.1 FG-GAP repeat protein [Xanthomonadales bacterium]MCB1577474.1 FG-GAP repeat protein [Xanthomonadales bacterium]
MKPRHSIETRLGAAPPRRFSSACKQALEVAVLVCGLASGDSDAQSLLLADTEPGAELAYATALDGPRLAAGAPGDFSRSGVVHAYHCVGQSCTAPVALIPIDLAPGDLFGAALSLSADTLAIGAPGQGAGAVYVYVHDGSGWLLQQKLGATPTLPDERFGAAVAAQVDRLVVGAPAADNGAGALYVFERSNGTWAQTDRLQADDASPGDALGSGVALSGSTLLGGAPQWAPAVAGSYGRGAVYVFENIAADWTQQARLQPLTAANGDLFGSAVSLSGDRALVGAPLADAGAGGAFVFTRSAQLWTQQAHLAAPGGLAGDRFGWSVSLDGDQLLVGAPFALAGCGGVTRFVFNGASWLAAAGPGLAQTTPGGLVGWSVGAQTQRWLVGVPGYSGAPSHVGAAYWRDSADAIFIDGYDDVGAAACAAAD